MKQFMIFIFALGLSAHAANPSLPCSAPCLYQPQTVDHSGISRYYAAYFPARVVASTPYPLIVVLNGANIVAYNNPKLDAQLLLQSFADANNVAILWVFSAVYDTTLGLASQPYTDCTIATDACQWVWDLPFYFTGNYTNYDDFGYITNRITNAETAWGADSSRILLIGGSTGGIEAHAYAQANSGNVLAIGTFAGPVWAQNGSATPPAPAGNVNVFMAHGDADPTLPYCGGPTSNPWYGLSGISTASADQTFNYWTSATGMNCSTITPATNLCPTSGGVLQKIATGCRGGRRAMFVRYPGANHLTVSNYSYGLLAAFWSFAFSAASNPTVTAVASGLNPSSVFQSVAFTAKVSSSFGTPTGAVTFVKNGVPFATATLSGGQATLNWAFVWAGTKSISAMYSGDANFAASTSSTQSQVVNQATTATELVSSANNSIVGQFVTFTVTVAGQEGGIPTGTVTFVNNGATSGTAMLSGGQATINKAFNIAGTHIITAVYSGDSNFVTSTSYAVSQVVNPATTTTTLSLSPNPSMAGQSVALRVTVTPETGGIPTGSVTFMNGTVTLGTAMLSLGQATLNETFVAKRTGSLTAIYSGDSNFITSTGTATQTVQ